MSLLCVRPVDIRRGGMCDGQRIGEIGHQAKEIVALARTVSYFETYDRRAQVAPLLSFLLELIFTHWWIIP